MYVLPSSDVNCLKRQSIVAALIRYLDFLERACVSKRAGTREALAGDPDVSALIRGKHFECSVRERDDRLTSAQRERLERWERAGAVVGIVSCLEDAKRIFKEHGVEY